MNDEKNGEKDRIEIDFSKGKVSFEGIFRGLGGLVDMVEGLGSTETVTKEGEIKGTGDARGVRGVYGFTVKTLAGRPIIETFGNKSTKSAGRGDEEIREPIVDVFDEGEQLVVISEMPGVEEKNISITVMGKTLIITALNNARRYSKEILLSVPVKTEPVVHSYKNGILEIRLEKEK